MQKILTIIFMFIVAVFSGRSQTVINGSVISLKGEAQPGELVVLSLSGGDKIISYAFTDDNGMYNLTYKGTSDSIIVKVSGLNIVAQSKKVPNKSQKLNFIVEEKDIKLKEVVVKSQRIWGARDTVNYLVDAFRAEKDLVIGDVLKKMPGIDVEASGQIRYKGKPINKFYIENLDLLQGRYGIATQNISAKDVATVQVLENHQPIKALSDIKFTDRAAINLKLKEEAKGVLSIMAKLGLGASPLLWDNELAGMYFARKKQNMTT